MSTKTIENFFTGKTLVIPSYQRDYAWKERNVSDLFDDVEEALEVGSDHYLGTFILSQKDKSVPVHVVVDGQQRLTTLTTVLDALIDAVEEESIKQYYRSTFITYRVTGPKFKVMGEQRDVLPGITRRKEPGAGFRWPRAFAEGLSLDSAAGPFSQIPRGAELNYTMAALHQPHGGARVRRAQRGQGNSHVPGGQ